jgi:unsaturated rhamnogalacturonyl hydrolase
MNAQRRLAGFSLVLWLSLGACADDAAAPAGCLSRGCDDAGAVPEDTALVPSRVLPSAAAVDFEDRRVDFSNTAEAPEARARREAHDEARRVIDAVARRQLAPLADGGYALASWEAVTRNAPPRGIAWNYPWGVTLYGMLRASAVTGDAAYGDFVTRHNEIVGRAYGYLVEVNARYGAAHRREVDDVMRRAPVLGALVLGSLDNCGAMSSQLLEGASRGALTSGERALMSSVGDYISARQSRLPDGAFWRPEWAQTLWIDDLFMSCPFLVRWARQTGERRHYDDAARQIIAFASRQQDADGLWFHASFVGADRLAPFKWGRANGWAMVATVEVLSALPEDHPDRPRVLDILRRHIDGVKRLQAPSGRWRQVLDHPELWEETSCTAMFTYSIARAVSRGWIPRDDLSVALRGMQGLGDRVAADGSIRDTCEGTVIGQDLAYYATRAHPLNDVHGPGPALLAAAEVFAATE